MRITRLLVHATAGFVILVLLVVGAAFVSIGLDDLRRSTVRGVTGEWRAYVLIGVILLACTAVLLIFLVRRARRQRRTELELG